MQESGGPTAALLLATWNQRPLFDSAQHERRVLGTERDAVAHGVFDLKRASGLGHVVEVAVGVGFLQIDGGWELVVLHCDQRGGDAGCATRALRMPDLRF